MINILLCGAGGAMGREVINAAEENPNTKIISGVSLNAGNSCLSGVCVHDSFEGVTESFDIILDFSHPSVIESLLNFAVKNKKPVVIATTGFSCEQEALINGKSKLVPILKASNFSIGVNKFKHAVAAFAKDWAGDIEIIETHHNLKKDAPSGTALAIAEAIIKARGFGNLVLGRTRESGKREDGDIGISSVRGGTVAGEHEVRFFSSTCEISFKDREYGKSSFAHGALKACEFIINKKPGLYGIDDLLAKG